ncbi:MAG: BatA domain-containing protein [Planctomycetes bacterium]|nr:BatA domain-containing protein [Planctomycetota bacterium]
MALDAAPLLWGLLLLGIPLAIHLLMKDRPKELRFPTLRFLKEAAKDEARRLRLRHLALLLLRMFLLAAVVTAAARPKVRMGAGEAGKDSPVDAVFILDDSPSMTLAKGGTPLLEEAKVRAARAAEDLPVGSRFSLATRTRGPTPFTLRPVSFAGEVATVGVDWAGGPLDPALARSRALVRDREDTSRPAEIYVFSDGTRGSLTPQAFPGWPEDLPVRYVDLSEESPPDFSIEGLALSASEVLPGSTVEVRGFLRAERASGERVLDLAIDGRVVESRLVRVEEGSREPFSFSLAAPTPGPLRGEVRIREHDSLAANDARFFAVLVRPSSGVAVVLDEAAYLAERAPPGLFPLLLALDPSQDGRRFRRLAIPESELAERDLSGLQVVVVPDVPLVEEAWAALRRYVAEGGALLVLPGPGTAGAGAGGTTYRTPSALEILPAEVVGAEPFPEPVGLAGVLADHPALAAFDAGANGDLLAVRFRTVLRVAPHPDSTVAAIFAERDLPAWVERPYGKGDVVLFAGGCHPDWTTFPRELSFVPFLQEALRYLTGERRAATDFPAGGEAEVSLPSPGTGLRLVVVGPADLSREIALPKDRPAARFALDEGPGHYGYVVTSREAVEGGPFPIRGAVAANVSPSETDLDRLDAGELASLLGPSGRALEGGRAFRAELAGGESWVSLVPLFLLLALAAITAENWLSNFFHK